MHRILQIPECFQSNFVREYFFWIFLMNKYHCLPVTKFDILTHCVFEFDSPGGQQWHWPPLFFFAAGSHSEGMGKDSSSMGPHSVDTSTTVSIITSSADRKENNSCESFAWVYVWPKDRQQLMTTELKTVLEGIVVGLPHRRKKASWDM